MRGRFCYRILAFGLMSFYYSIMFIPFGTILLISLFPHLPVTIFLNLSTNSIFLVHILVFLYVENNNFTGKKMIQLGMVSCSCDVQKFTLYNTVDAALCREFGKQ